VSSRWFIPLPMPGRFAGTVPNGKTGGNSMIFGETVGQPVRNVDESCQLSALMLVNSANLGET
jgi:hypothetical protein